MAIAKNYVCAGGNQTEKDVCNTVGAIIACFAVRPRQKLIYPDDAWSQVAGVDRRFVKSFRNIIWH